MRKTALFVVTFILLGSLSGCGNKDTYESLTKESMQWMKDYISLMAKVKDDESAKKVKPDLETLARGAEQLLERFKALGIPSKEDDERVEKKYKSDLDALLPKYAAANKKQEQYAVLREVKVTNPTSH
jgi:hypothetical protein